jgi:signal transduction histidine kinase
MDLAARERLEIYKFDLAVTEGETDTMEELDLTILAEEALESCWMLTESQGVETRLEASEPVKILGSWSLLTRALANLVRNSVSLSRPGEDRPAGHLLNGPYL